MRIYVVLEREGDGYQEYPSRPVVAFFYEELAERHARILTDEESGFFYVEEIPVAPQTIEGAPR